MRTTVTIDDDVLAAARSLARHDGRSVGAVLSDLARRGLERPLGARPQVAGRRFPVFEPGPAAEQLTTERVAELLDEG